MVLVAGVGGLRVLPRDLLRALGNDDAREQPHDHGAVPERAPGETAQRSASAESPRLVTFSGRRLRQTGGVGATTTRGVARAVFVSSMVAPILALGLAASHGGALLWIPLWGLPTPFFASVGLVLCTRVPRNRIGWLFLCFGFVLGLGVALDAYGALALSAPGGGVAALVANLLEPLSLFAVPGLLLLFPEGRLPSPRWRPAALAWVLAVIALALDIILSPGPISTFSDAEMPQNPIGIRSSSGVGGAIGLAGIAGLAVLVLLSLATAASLVSRFRRSSGVLREQLKWFGAATAFLALTILTGPFGLWNVGSGILWEFLVALGLTAVVFATGIAILRYRLYEIDRLVSRTISYALLTAMLVGVFVGVVALTTRVLPFASPVAVAASTLAAAALFNPLRQRLQHIVDRRFNRARYNAEAIVAAFTARLQEAVDLDTVREDLLSSVRCVQPVHASLWIRPRDPNARA